MNGGPGLGASPVGGMTEGLLTCPICRTPQTGRYCEECGYDYDLAAQQAPSPQQHQQHQYQPQPAQQQYQPPQQQHGYEYPPPAPMSPPPPPAHLPPAPGYGYPPQQQPEPEQQLGQQQNGYGRQQAQQQPAMGGGEPYPTSFHLPPPSQPVRPEPPARSTWMAVVSADRDYFTDMMARSGPEASGLFFPPYCPERRIPLTGRGQLRIGRRSQHRGTVPEIDLSVPPEDPGASHQHALLAEQPDGSWVLVDQDSTNGTTVNGGAEPIAPHTAVPLNDGDRIHVGAWTTITLHRA
ncbi:FHA domain-containing protein [Kitasatospora mediocidica]|uniref:FHA domain-containing protein n=1 Tax=Kitasatospora mediocidica TaxID=58352 RepID=UPI0006916690